MSDTAITYLGDPRRLQSITGAVTHSGPASKRIVTGFGFWIFILSDMVMFSAFFATYAVLLGQTAAGPSGHDLFNLRNVAIETGFLLARARHHLDRRIHRRVSARERKMTIGRDEVFNDPDVAPGDEQAEGGGIVARVVGYLTGLGLAILLTATSFFVAGTDLVWQPSIPVALAVLAIAQMGVHLVFFLHITTGPDNTNNVLALAFGVLIVFLVMAGSLWIMANLNHNMMPMDQLMQMQR